MRCVQPIGNRCRRGTQTADRRREGERVGAETVGDRLGPVLFQMSAERTTLMELAFWKVQIHSGCRRRR